MGKTEAFCTQCGSLINIDGTKEKNKCLFCGADIATQKALDLVTDTETRVALQKESEKKAAELAREKKAQQKQNRFPKAETAAAAASKDTVVIKPVPMKTKLIMTAVFVGIALILTAIFVPLILTRNDHRIELYTQISKEISFEVESYTFQNNDNRGFLIATGAVLEKEDAVLLYEDYVKAYAAEYGISAEKAQGKLFVKLYAANGMFECKTADGQTQAVFYTATPTPTPTVSASSSSASSASASK